MTKGVVESIENGPNLLRIDGKADVAFCRCGHSEKELLCDGTHRKVDFRAPRRNDRRHGIGRRAEARPSRPRGG